MGDVTGIQWADHTFNPWWGCARVSPACRFCYADTQARRYGFQVWRRHGPRRMLSDANWARPFKWNREAEASGIPAKVFCASMADVFEDHPDVPEARKRLWDVIERTPWLRWQLLTKRPENVNRMVPWGDFWPSWVWLGTSVENPRLAGERIPLLYDTAAKTLFLSCEPLLAPVDLGLGVDHSAHGRDHINDDWGWDCLDCSTEEKTVPWTAPGDRRLSWVIVGGESGPRSRPTELAWIEDVVAQCRAAGVAPFVKQLGKVLGQRYGAGPKGADMERWPESVRVREFPAAAEAVSA